MMKFFVPRRKSVTSGDRWGDKMGDNLQLSKLKIKNMQIDKILNA